MKNQKTNINLSVTFALIALAVSIASIYFSIFYKDHDLTVSLIDSHVEYSGNVVTAKLLYHNQGNTYSTVIQDYLTFYQNEDWENEGAVFNKGIHVFQIEYNPVVLVPGEQILRHLQVETNFNEIDTTHRKLDLRKKINVGLVATYINDVGLRTSDMFPIGYILLNDSAQIIKYNLNYNVFELDGSHYYSSARIE